MSEASTDNTQIDEESTRQYISCLGDEWAAAEKIKDVGFVKNLLANEWVLTSTNGLLISKEEWLAKIPETLPLIRFDRSDIKVRLFGETVILTGVANMESLLKSGVYRYADVFVKQSGKWRVVYSHFTPIE